MIGKERKRTSQEKVRFVLLCLARLPLVLYAWFSASWASDTTWKKIESLEQERIDLARYRRQRMYTRLRVEYGVVTGRAVDDGIGAPIDVRYAMSRIISNLVSTLEVMPANRRMAPTSALQVPHSRSARRLSQAYETVSELMDDEDFQLKDTHLRVMARSFVKYPANASLVDGEFLLALPIGVLTFFYFRSTSSQWIAYVLAYFGTLQICRRLELYLVETELKKYEAQQAARQARVNHAFEHLIAAMRASNRDDDGDIRSGDIRSGAPL